MSLRCRSTEVVQRRVSCRMGSEAKSCRNLLRQCSSLSLHSILMLYSSRDNWRNLVWLVREAYLRFPLCHDDILVHTLARRPPIRQLSPGWPLLVRLYPHCMRYRYAAQSNARANHLLRPGSHKLALHDIFFRVWVNWSSRCAFHYRCGEHGAF